MAKAPCRIGESGTFRWPWAATAGLAIVTGGGGGGGLDKGQSVKGKDGMGCHFGSGGDGGSGGLTGPVQFVRKLLESWRLDEADAGRLLGFDPEDFDHVAAVLDGRRPLRGRDVRDRIAHLFSIRRTLWSLFRDLDTENDWLREAHSLLDGRSPLSLIVDGSMEELLLARDYVESAAGVR